MVRRPVAVVYGTRPEVIKLAPVLRELSRCAIHHIAINSGQHTHLTKPFEEYFDIRPHVILPPLRGPLPHKLADLQVRLADCFQTVNPRSVVVQGDTLTAFAGATSAFYQHRPVVHVEAGLRSGDIMAPWPEEMHRRAIAACTTKHCAPTKAVVKQLRKEGLHGVTLTGNTILDAVGLALSRAAANEATYRVKYLAALSGKFVLVTGHRRENIGDGLENVVKGIVDALMRTSTPTRVLWAGHKNPAVQQCVLAAVEEHVPEEIRDNFRVCEPLGYEEFVYLMREASCVVSDSGGIQEEITTVDTPLLVTRELTERPEAVKYGYAKLVGTDPSMIDMALTHVLETGRLPEDDEQDDAMPSRNPFAGLNGTPSKDVVSVIESIK